MKARTKALAATGAVALVVAAAALILTAPTGNQDTAASPTAGLHATGTLGFPVSDIKIGQGGTATGPDGKTPVGYSGDCTSAAQAAANYAPLVYDMNPKAAATQRNTLLAVSEPTPWRSSWVSLQETMATMKGLGTGGLDGGWVTRTEVNAGGMYRVESCEDKKKAVVQVLVGMVSAQVNGDPQASFASVSMELSWDGDWKISDGQYSGADDITAKVRDDGPAGPAGPAVDGKALPLTKDLVDGLFGKKGREGWVEYANAVR
jgi:hypothetical protein